MLEDDPAERLERHMEDGEIHGLVEELVAMYEADGTFLREGHSEGSDHSAAGGRQHPGGNATGTSNLQGIRRRGSPRPVAFV